MTTPSRFPRSLRIAVTIAGIRVGFVCSGRFAFCVVPASPVDFFSSPSPSSSPLPSFFSPERGCCSVCERVSGDTLCEPRHRWNGKQCVPDVAGEQAKLAGTHPTRPREAAGSAASGTADTEPAPQVISRSRTPQHDTDCKRHWPKTPASYLFKGGKNYPSRKPAVSNAGCVPRDMGWSWTSACCPG